MDLYFNEKPEFTRWVVANGALREDFVVIDVGVQGGANPRWQALGDRLVLHGFDPIKEEIDKLNAAPANHAGRRRYHWCAIGESDGEQDFYFTPAQPTQSSFFQPGENRINNGKARFETRRVTVRSLDSLLAAGEIPSPDFFKVDVEGYEKYVLAGAKTFLSDSLLGIEAETSFNTSNIYPTTHIGNLQEELLPHGFLLFDINFDRQPRASYAQARAKAKLSTVATGRPGTFIVLFCRDPIAEATGTQSHRCADKPFSADTIIKAMIIYELHGLVDVAYDLTVFFEKPLADRFDIARARELLLNQVPARANAYFENENTLAAIYNSTSWKVTAPLRALKRAIS